ncbi:Nucleotide-binding, alpha-beta plait [Artemisia annua]|uniref:Nucleotide-binding, alpha-beta plait n=1 Tax=Artemisia annua TaxID=35608 RepID=A0A2U1LSP2_ARTAN|nr:Nucleotide-binding, alpha-beta plait [Artemisia annua]
MILPLSLPPPPQPTRTLLISPISITTSESTIRKNLEVFGDIRAVQMERIHTGTVTVHFYDIRHAVQALSEIQQQHMQQQFRLRKHFEGFRSFGCEDLAARGLVDGKVIWAEFVGVFAVSGGIPDGYNQGTVVVSGLDYGVGYDVVRDVFQAYGCVKEIRDNPLNKNQKFVEFYDIRDASKAVANMKGQKINRKPVFVEFNRPGGHKHNHKQNKFMPISPVRVQSPPCRKDRVGDYGGAREGKNVISPNGVLKKNIKNLYKQPQLPTKQWKGSRNTREKIDPRFSFKEDGIMSTFHDSRTTVMIKNIPNKYSQKLLLNMLDNHCIHCNEQIEASDDNEPLSAYDFLYLPIDFVNKCNVGYGFVNMTSPEATRRLYKAFHHQNWEVFNSKKICEVSYARLQGLEALKDHFKNSKFPRETEEYMPVTFTPPRDGQTLTDPMPVVGRNSTTTSIASPSTSSSSEKMQNLLQMTAVIFDFNDDVEIVSRFRSVYWNVFFCVLCMGMLHVVVATG